MVPKNPHKWESCSFVVRAEAESQEEPKVAETEVLEETEVEAKAEGAVEIAVTTEERPTFKPRVELGDIIGNRIQTFIPSITPNGIFALYSLLCRHGNINLLPDQIRSDAHISSFRLKVPSPELKISLKIKEKLEASMTLKKLLLMSFLPRTSIVIADGVVSNFSIGYDSDDPSFEILEGKADGKIWKQYYKGWTESERNKLSCANWQLMISILRIYKGAYDMLALFTADWHTPDLKLGPSCRNGPRPKSMSSLLWK
ncbi:hypothetical protein T459_15325 [Capsicum annuum]|uniref:Uncharacterized protein n=1 Tax=Capsicum annuum TaxID=4072 RepID=A0A2G2ZJZ4_CAPAN|nr:hypothetical protein T459_15325 [Capsicum annuum]